jgi:aminoglycoside 6-adenylyltransferase
MADEYATVIRNLTAFAQGTEGVDAAVLVGSHGRDEQIPTAHRDLDLLLVVTNPDDFVDTSRWVATIGRLWFATQAPAYAGIARKQFLIDDAIALDVLFARPDQLESTSADAGPLAQLLRRGYKVLAASETSAERLAALAANAGLPDGANGPSADEFAETSARFWYETVDCARALANGELWAAKQIVDCSMKSALATMMRWYAQALHGPDKETYWGIHRIAQWADPKVLAQAQGTFASFDAKSVRDCLFATMDLFRMLSIEVAHRFALTYPEVEDRRATVWARTLS